MKILSLLPLANSTARGPAKAASAPMPCAQPATLLPASVVVVYVVVAYVGGDEVSTRVIRRMAVASATAMRFWA